MNKPRATSGLGLPVSAYYIPACGSALFFPIISEQSLYHSTVFYSLLKPDAQHELNLILKTVQYPWDVYLAYWKEPPVLRFVTTVSLRYRGFSVKSCVIFFWGVFVSFFLISIKRKKKIRCWWRNYWLQLLEHKL